MSLIQCPFKCGFHSKSWIIIYMWIFQGMAFMKLHPFAEWISYKILLFFPSHANLGSLEPHLCLYPGISLPLNNLLLCTSALCTLCWPCRQNCPSPCSTGVLWEEYSICFAYMSVLGKPATVEMLDRSLLTNQRKRYVFPHEDRENFFSI